MAHYNTEGRGKELKSAGIIIIGDEILSGMVEDCNSLFMTRELRMRGVSVRKIAVIPDDIDDIAQEVKIFSDRFDFVLTSGGIGPTHDDVSIDGIAKAFNVAPVINDYLKSILDSFYCGDLTPERLKMATVPEGAELITDRTLKFPLIRFRNIFIFPGIPQYLREKFYVIEKLFDGPQLHFKRVFINEYESSIAPFLNEVVNSHKDVKIGSYPILNNKDYRVILTLESLDQKELDSAIDMLAKGEFKENIVRVEG